MFQWDLEERMQAPSLVLPTDAPDRVRLIMQHVEKRAARSIPRAGLDEVVTVCLGAGVGNWPRMHRASPFNPETLILLPWTTEPDANIMWPTAYSRGFECA